MKVSRREFRSKDGARRQSEFYSIRLQHQGRDVELTTPLKDRRAAWDLGLYLKLALNAGWVSLDEPALIAHVLALQTGATAPGEPWPKQPQKAEALRFEDLRDKLIQDYRQNCRKSLLTLEDGSQSICGVKALEAFFAGWRASELTTKSFRDFTSVRQILGRGQEDVRLGGPGWRPETRRRSRTYPC